MGWLWMCLGIRNKSARRIGRRVSSDTYDSRLAHQYDFTRTPRIEDFLDPRAAGYDAFVSSSVPESPTSPNKTSSLGRYSDENWEKDLRARALDGNDWSYEGAHDPQNSASFNERIRKNYEPYWDYSDDMPELSLSSVEFPRVTPPPRKSTSKHLIEFDDGSNGSMALDAVPAVAKSSAKSQEPSSPHALQSKSDAGRTNSHPNHSDPRELLSTPKTARSQPPHSGPPLDRSENRMKASNAAAAASKDGRQQTRESDFISLDQSAPKPNYIGSFFSSSRKRSLHPGSCLSQPPLSTVAESFPQTEELRTKRISDVTFQSSVSSDLPQGGRESHDEVSSSKDYTDNQQQKAPGGLSLYWSGTEALDTELAKRDVSEFLFKEEWDDYVLVEKVEELPIKRGQRRHEPLEIETNSGSYAEVASGQRDGKSSGDRGDDRGLSPAEGEASSINGRILDQRLDSSTSGSEVTSRDEADSASLKITTFEKNGSGIVPPAPIKIIGSQHGGRRENDMVIGTPVRDVLVSPEVFMSPKTTTSELNFMRVTDMDPEERPIFGSLAGHWEAAWATKRPAWDGKGIPNSTHKYREDQKVMWHATSFEERLAQALASQESVPQRRSYRFKGPTTR